MFLSFGIELHILLSKSQKLIVTSLYFQNLRDGITPNIKRLQNLAQPQQLHVSESGVGLLQVRMS